MKPADNGAPYCAQPVSQVNGWGTSANIEYSISDNVKLTSITGYRSYDANWVQDYDASQLSNALLTYKADQLAVQRRKRGLRPACSDGKVDLVVGGFYINRSGTYSGIINQGLLVFTEYDEIPASNWAGFANVSWRMTDKLEAERRRPLLRREEDLPLLPRRPPGHSRQRTGTGHRTIRPTSPAPSTA